MTLCGVIPAVLTPFDSEGRVAYGQLGRYVDWLISKGVHGLFPCGTNGEGPAMTAMQRIHVVEAVVKAAAGRVPVVAMTGAISTEESIALTRAARDQGCSGAAVVAPWYFPHDDLALEAHFSAVAEAVPDFDLYLYNIPGNAKNAISPGLAARLAQRYPQFKGAKDSSKSLENLKAYVAALPGRSVIVGTDAMVIEAMDAGAVGVVSAIADCFPEVMVGLYEACRAGNRAEAGALQARAVRLRDILKQGPYVHPYKLAVAWRGVDFTPGMRAPLRACTADEAAAIRGALADLGVLA
jgi:dihydrodipicolinate synthase/N-acetylneuraminate lyase